MVNRLAQMRRAAACPHVEPVRNKAGVDRGPSHAVDVTRVPVPLQAVEQNHLSDGRERRALRLYPHLCVFVCSDQPVFDRKTRGIVLARPEIGKNREKVRIR